MKATKRACGGGSDSGVGYVDFNDVPERGKDSLPGNSRRILESSQVGSAGLFEETPFQREEWDAGSSLSRNSSRPGAQDR